MTVKMWIQAGLAAIAPGRAVLKWFVDRRIAREKAAAEKLQRDALDYANDFNENERYRVAGRWNYKNKEK
jgi:hypothetical protein